MKRRLAILFLLMFFAGLVFSQEPQSQQTIEDLIESVGETLSDDTDLQEILDDLEYFRQNPLRINSAGVEELKKLHLLSDFQIYKLLEYREKTGTIFSIYELASVDGFTPDMLQKLEPFVRFEAAETVNKRKRPDTDIFLRTTRSFTSSATDNSKNEGSPGRLYFRMKHTAGKLEYGLVSEKDPGEAFFRQSNKHGFDYYSGFVNATVGRSGNRIYAGDYHVRFGQGLVAWQGFSMGKSAETTQVFRSNTGIRSYSSTDENLFFRGLAGQFRFKNLTFSPFVALNQLDASVDSLDSTTYFGAFQTSGYHRTQSEIAGENTVKQLAAGGNVSYSAGTWTIGVTGIYNRFNAIVDRDDQPYNQFLPEGRDHLAMGFDWKGSWRRIFLFGEAAVSQNSGKALLTGLMLKPAQNAELSLVYRNINKTYFSYFANAFTESSRINDEHALYVGLKVFPAARWMFQAYTDFFRHEWLKYLTAGPSSGTEFFAQVSYHPTRSTQVYLRYFQEEKGQKVTEGNSRFNEQQLINRLRLNFSHKLSEQFSLKSRAEVSFYSKQVNEKGLMIYQDIFFKPREKFYALNARLAWFNTDGYDSRIYAYENDLLYTFSVPAHYRQGIRGYLNLQQKIGAHFSFWLKLAATRQFAGSDDGETVDAMTKSEVKFQVRYQF